MIFEDFAYIRMPGERTPERLLEHCGMPRTLAHVRAVAQECARIAERFGLDKEKCCLAGILHDVSAVIRREDMLRWAKERGMPLCQAEERYPFLLHQRLSRIAAEEAFGVQDQDVLSAVECHTTLKANAAPCDMALFIADKIAWDQPGEPPYLKAVEEALEQSLEAACLAYMTYTEEAGKLLYPHDQWTEAVCWLRETIQVNRGE